MAGSGVYDSFVLDALLGPLPGKASPHSFVLWATSRDGPRTLRIGDESEGRDQKERVSLYASLSNAWKKHRAHKHFSAEGQLAFRALSPLRLPTCLV